MRIPRVSGRSDSALKYLMVCCWLSSNRSKLSFVRLGISAPCLSLTLKNNWTTSTFTFSVSTDWSCASLSEVERVWGAELVLDVGPVEEAGGAGGARTGGFCAAEASDSVVMRASVPREGAPRADMARAKKPTARHGLQCNLSISVFYPEILLVYLKDL